MTEDVKKVVEREDENWSTIFKAQLDKKSVQKFSSFWWESYYHELTDVVNKMMVASGFSSVLEAGSGSGKATLLLNRDFNKTLLDISPTALEYAKYVAGQFEVSDVNFIQGNIFSMPFKNNAFDLVWNIGVVEHYQLNDIKSIVKEMVRVCNKSGYVAVGVPNFYSGPILKARLLKSIKFIPGYKLDTEKFYTLSQMENIFTEVSKESGKKIVSLEAKYFGNPLIMETPGFILKTVGGFVSHFFIKNRFLLLIVCKFE